MGVSITNGHPLHGRTVLEMLLRVDELLETDRGASHLLVATILAETSGISISCSQIQASCPSRGHVTLHWHVPLLTEL